MNAPELREYQSEAVDQIVTAIAEKRPVLACLPTGAGKTEVAVAVAYKLKQQGLRVLFSVDKTTLLDQAAARFTKYGLNVGLLGAGHKTATESDDVTVVTIQTLKHQLKKAKALNIPGEYAVCFVDEAHTNHKIEAELRALMPVVGLTATPHGHHIEDAYNELIKVVTIADLVGQEYLVPAKLYAPRSQINLTNVSRSTGDFALNSMADAAAKIQGDILANWKRYASDRPTLVFASNVAHAEQLADAFNAEGVPAASISYQTNRSEVTDILDQFETGRLQVVTSVNKIAAGFDAPWASCVVLARATASECLYIQMVGRGLRPYGEKEDCLLLDHGRNASRFGNPNLYEPPELHEASERASPRFHDEQKEHFCLPCGAQLTSRYAICKACGAKPEKVHPSNIKVPQPTEAWLEHVSVFDDLEDIHAIGLKEFYQQSLLYCRAFDKKEGMAWHAAHELFPWERIPKAWGRVPKSVELSEMVAGYHKAKAEAYRKQKKAEKLQWEKEAREREERTRQQAIRERWIREQAEQGEPANV